MSLFLTGSEYSSNWFWAWILKLWKKNIINLLDVISPTIQRRICASGLVSSGCGTKSGDELDITQVWRALAAPEGSVFSMSGSGGSETDGNKTDMTLITPASMRKLQLGHLYLYVISTRNHQLFGHSYLFISLTSSHWCHITLHRLTVLVLTFFFFVYCVACVISLSPSLTRHWQSFRFYGHGSVEDHSL